MRVRRSPFLWVLLTAGLGALACSAKRPPAVATDATAGADRGAQPAGARGQAEPEQAVEAGPDLKPVEAEAAMGRDIAGSEAGERGPLGDIHFEFDQAALSEQAKRTLEQHAAWLKLNPGASVTIEGHCDERGTVEYNLALGEQRAKAAHEYLVGLGIAEERLSTVSYGKERPLDGETGEAAWARNRRAHFAVSR